jgi:hypothetical protein
VKCALGQSSGDSSDRRLGPMLLLRPCIGCETAFEDWSTNNSICRSLRLRISRPISCKLSSSVAKTSQPSSFLKSRPNGSRSCHWSSTRLDIAHFDLRETDSYTLLNGIRSGWKRPFPSSWSSLSNWNPTRHLLPRFCRLHVRKGLQP